MFSSVSATRKYCAWTLYCKWKFLFNAIKSTALIIIKSLTSRTRKAEILSYRATYSSKYISCILNSHILSDQWLHLLNEQIIQTNVKKHCSHLPIVGRQSNNDTFHNEESYEESDNKYWPDCMACSGMARVPSGASPVRNFSTHHSSQSQCLQAFSTCVGQANACPLQPPLWSSRTHARASLLSTRPDSISPPLLVWRGWARAYFCLDKGWWWLGPTPALVTPVQEYAEAAAARPSPPAGNALFHEPRANWPQQLAHSVCTRRWVARPV